MVMQKQTQRCPACQSTMHQCKTGEPGCMHCDSDNDCAESFYFCDPGCPGWFVAVEEEVPSGLKGWMQIHRCDDCDLFADDLWAAVHVSKCYRKDWPDADKLAAYVAAFDAERGGHKGFAVSDRDARIVFDNAHAPRGCIAPELVDYAHMIERIPKRRGLDLSDARTAGTEHVITNATIPKLLADCNNALVPIGELLAVLSAECDILDAIWDSFDQDALNDAHEAFARLRAMLEFDR